MSFSFRNCATNLHLVVITLSERPSTALRLSPQRLRPSHPPLGPHLAAAMSCRFLSTKSLASPQLTIQANKRYALRPRHTYDWSRLPPEVRNMIYKFLFKPGPSCSEHAMPLFHLHKLSSQLLRCSQEILEEARGMLYDRSFRIDADLILFMRSADPHNMSSILAAGASEWHTTLARMLSRLSSTRTGMMTWICRSSS